MISASTYTSTLLSAHTLARRAVSTHAGKTPENATTTSTSTPNPTSSSSDATTRRGTSTTTTTSLSPAPSAWSDWVARTVGLDPSPELAAIMLVYFVQGILSLSRLATDYYFKVNPFFFF